MLGTRHHNPQSPRRATEYPHASASTVETPGTTAGASREEQLAIGDRSHTHVIGLFRPPLNTELR